MGITNSEEIQLIENAINNYLKKHSEDNNDDDDDDDDNKYYYYDKTYGKICNGSIKKEEARKKRRHVVHKIEAS